ncbi:MAG: enoyl-[acyl-carrier-protein] reductase FabK, partial [Deltaproteobacteria bacterium]|nr:enoyl-[acyl-carrier-protein] reductase FabK [Deltaproteobacteria bacterium]
VAAGGIGDSRGYRAAFALGAQGVQVGTRFIASRECIAHGNYKDALVQSNETDTRLVNMEWAQVRVVNTPLVEKMIGSPGKADFSAAGSSIEDAWVKGDLDANTIPAGQISGMVRDVKSVREIIEEMVAE